MVEQINRITELQEKFKKKYGRLVNHYKRWQSPEPDLTTDPKGHGKWEKSKDIMSHVLRLDWHDGYDGCPRPYRLLPKESEYDEYKVWNILRRLAIPINVRLDAMVENQQKRHWVESPTNAKQTLRAIIQIDQRLTEKIERDEDEFNTELDELRNLRDSGGGFSADGTYRNFSQEELEELDKKIQEQEQSCLAIDFCNPETKRTLILKKGKYFDLLPSHYKEKYRSTEDIKPQ